MPSSTPQRPRADIKRCLAALLLVGCTSTTQWPDAERLCDQDIPACAAKCDEGDTGFCNALAVMRVQEDRRYLEWRGVDYFGLDHAGPEELKALGKIASYGCRVYKSKRACSAVDALSPLAAAAATKPLPPAQEGALARLREAQRLAQEIAPRDERIGQKLFEASRLLQTGPGANPLMHSRADAIVRGVMADLEGRQAKQKQKQATKQQTESRKQTEKRELAETGAAVEAALAACSSDVPTCQQKCADKAASDECAALALLHTDGDARLKAGGRNPKRGRELARAGCTAGNKACCHVVAFLDYQAANCAEKGGCKLYCDGGFGAACAEAGAVLLSGDDGDRHYAEANAWFKRACDLNSATGCFKLGIAHFEGLGVIKNGPQAQKFFKQACDLGEQLACAMYERSCLDLKNCK